MNIRRINWMLAWLCIVLATGCRDAGPQRYQVSGSVSYDGRPVPIGTIRFEPTRDAGLEAPTGFAVIRDGKFRTEAGQGAGVGPYVARISAGDGATTKSGVAATTLDPDGSPDVKEPYGEPLVHEYEHPLELPAHDSTHEIAIAKQ